MSSDTAQGAQGGSLFSRGFQSSRRTWVGRMVEAKEDSRTFDDGSTRQSFALKVEPLTRAVETLDGMLQTFWPYSDKKNSTWYKIKTMINVAYEAAFGTKPGDLSDLFGKPMLYADIEPEFDEMFAKVKEEFRPKRGFILPVGPAPEDWVAGVPADLADQKLAAIARKRSRMADADSGVGSISDSTPVASPNGVAGDSLNALIDEYKAVLLTALDGEQASTVVKTAASYRGQIPEELLRGIFAGKVQEILTERKDLALVSGTYRATAAATT